MLGKILIMSTILISSRDITIRNNGTSKVYTINKTYESVVKDLSDSFQKELDEFKTNATETSEGVKKLSELLSDKSENQNANIKFEQKNSSGGVDAIEFSSKELHTLFSSIDLTDVLERRAGFLKYDLRLFNNYFDYAYEEAVICVVNKEHTKEFFRNHIERSKSIMIGLTRDIANLKLFMQSVQGLLDEYNKKDKIPINEARLIWIKLCKNLLVHVNFETSSHKFVDNKVIWTFKEPDNFDDDPLWNKVQGVLNNSRQKCLNLE